MPTSKVLCGVGLCLLFAFLSPCSAVHVYIRPDNSSWCVRKPCYTLSEYIGHLNVIREPIYAYNNYYVKYLAVINTPVDLLFAAGLHTLQLDGVLSLESYGIEMSMAGTATSLPNGELSVSQIECIGTDSGLDIIGSSKFVLQNIAIIKCGAIVSHITISHATFAAVYFHDITSLLLVNVSISRSYGYGLIVGHSLDIAIKNCTFDSNFGSRHYFGGNIAILSFFKYGTLSLLVESTTIIGGYSSLSSHEYVPGLSVVIRSSMNARITITDTKFINNTSEAHSPAGNLLIRIKEGGRTTNYSTVSISLTESSIQGGLGLSGGCMIIIERCDIPSDLKNIVLRTKINVFINSSSFSNNEGYTISGGLGFEQINICSEFVLKIHNSLFEHNEGSLGAGGLYITVRSIPILQDKYPSMRNLIEIQNCTIIKNTVHESFSFPATRAGLVIDLYDLSSPEIFFHEYRPPAVEIIISKSVISHNKCRESCGLDLIVRSSTTSFEVVIANCTFENNTVDNGAAISIIYEGNFRSALNLTLELVSFGYTYSYGSGTSSTAPAVVYMDNVNNVILRDCNFYSNNISALFLSKSEINIQGLVIFEKNTARKGGAMLLCSGSILMPLQNTMVKFLGNHAHHTGGAIHAEQKCHGNSVRTSCFLKPPFAMPTLLSSVKFIFIDNTANSAGSDIYGGSFDTCTSASWTGTEIIKNIFKLEEKRETALSSISSNPVGVCFCTSSNAALNCSTKTMQVSAFPGALFSIYAVIVGQLNGVVPGVVVTSPSSTLDQYQDHQSTGTKCTVMYYRVLSSETSVILTLTPKQPEPVDAPFTPPKLIVYLKDCPLGFQLSLHNTSKCDCIQLLAEKNVLCDIGSETILCPPSVWIGSQLLHNKSHKILYHPHCPLDYCKNQNVSLSLATPDQQCAFNRSGRLCGKCQHGLSLVLGSSMCKPCSNLWLLTLAMFGVAGIALVVILIALNITVSAGTVNGVVFYANILRANQAIFSQSGSNRILGGFIAWLNLDLGIDMCFYKGMDVYAKVWLQFAFPLYIWLIVLLIVIISRYSSTLAKLTGKRIVSVLATLFLLSYAKLLRTVILILSSAQIESSDGTVEKVWFYNGEVKYFHDGHIPLVTVAVLLLVLVSTPYTLILVFIQCLQAGTYRRPPLSWVHRLKPLFDAYTAPYKAKHRYWTGLLLLVRVALFLCFSVNHLGDPTMNLLFSTVMLLCMFMYLAQLGGVYNLWPINILEQSYLLNLCITSAILIYIGESSMYQAAVINSSVGLAFGTLILILIYHMLQVISGNFCPSWLNQKWISYFTIFRKNNKQTVSEMHSCREDASGTVSARPSVELREPLLECTI